MRGPATESAITLQLSAAAAEDLTVWAIRVVGLLVKAERRRDLGSRRLSSREVVV